MKHQYQFQTETIGMVNSRAHAIAYPIPKHIVVSDLDRTWHNITYCYCGQYYISVEYLLYKGDSSTTVIS